MKSACYFFEICEHMKTKWLTSISSLFFFSLFLFFTCSCTDKDTTPDVTTARLLYSSGSCVFIDVFAQDNETALIVDNCGNLKKIVLLTGKSTILADHLFYQGGFFTPSVPGSLFYLTLTKSNGVYLEPFLLNKIDLASGTIQTFVSDGLHNAFHGGYTTGNKKLAVQQPGSEELLVIDLENLSLHHYTIPGTFEAFSPDDSQAIIRTAGNSTVLYDFECECTQPLSFSGIDKYLWRQQGIFGVKYAGYGMQFQDLQTGTVLGSIDYALNWTASPQGTLISVFKKDTDYETSFMTRIETFDLVTKISKTIYPFKFNIISNTGITFLTPTPGEDKLLFVENSNKLKIIDLK